MEARGKWIHIQGNTWCIELRVMIPVFLCEGGDAILLDSGYAEDRAELLRLLAEKNLRVRAIIGSHAHRDHCGNHAWFQENCSAEIVMPRQEAVFAASYAGMRAIYAPASAARLAQLLPGLVFQADKMIAAGENLIEIGGFAFLLYDLPGHTFGHTGIMTPDHVLYVADAVLDEKTLAHSKLLSIMDWREDAISKERIKDICADAYILAHCCITDRIGELIQYNHAVKKKQAREISRWLHEKGPITLSEAERLVWNRLCLHSQKDLSQIVYQRNLRCLLEYLIQTGDLKMNFDGGTEVYM